MNSLKNCIKSFDHFVEKNLFVSLIGKLLWLLGLYALLQTLFDFPNLKDCTQYIFANSWSMDLAETTLSGSVEILSSNKRTDSLIAWSESEFSIPLKLHNNVSRNLRIDSVRVLAGLDETPLDFDMDIDKGELYKYRDSYILRGGEEIDLRLLPKEIKGNVPLLQSIMEGRQEVLVFTDRGICAQFVTYFVIRDGSGKVLKKISRI